MTYDPIDTSASDDTADSSATIDEIDATVLQGLNLDTVDAGRPVRIGEENGETVFNFVGPDNQIYLQDDFGDNKLTNRDDSDTTTYNGVVGVYRPEYTVVNSPSVSSQTLDINTGDHIEADINLDFSSDITWTFTNLAVDSGESHIRLFDEFGGVDDTAFFGGSNDGYVLVFGAPAGEVRLFDTSNSDNLLSFFISASTEIDLTVIRESTGNWEVLENGVQQGTFTDTNHTTATSFAMGARGGGSFTGSFTLDEYKVN